MNYVVQFKRGYQSDICKKAVQKAGGLRKVCKILNIPKGTYYSYKKERHNLPYTRFIKILDFLSMDFDSIKDEITILDRRWGSQKGGKISIRNLMDNNSLHKKLEYVRGFKKIEKTEIKMNEAFCEFYGVLMGDGCLVRRNKGSKIKGYIIIISGDKRYEMGYYSYLKNLLKTNFNVNSYVYKYNKINVIRLVINNKALYSFLEEFGFPIGKKYEYLKLPETLIGFPWETKKFLIRGLFDTDGTIFAKKNEGYKYPYIGFSSKNKTLIEQIKVLLRERGYPFYTNYNNLFMKGIGNVKRWMEDVGTSNPKHRFKYEYWVKHKKLPAYLLGQ